MTLTNKMFWLAIILECVFFIFLLKQEKRKKYSSVQKSYLTSRKGIGDRKKKEKNSKSESTSLTYFDNLKKKQQDQGSKNWCYRRFYVTDNLNFRPTAFYFEYTKLLK